MSNTCRLEEDSDGIRELFDALVVHLIQGVILEGLIADLELGGKVLESTLRIRHCINTRLLNTVEI